MHFRLFNKPAAFAIEDAGKHKMWIDGIYEDYYPAEPYEGYVQVHGNVGLMTVRIVDSNLPPGASVYIDQVLRRVIVKWAKYSPPTQEVTEVPNGSFRDGPAYWETTGDGTPIRFDDWSPNNAKSATYHDRKGEYIFVGAWAPVSSVNRQIEIKAKVEHGKSSKGNASCAIGLAWYNEDRQLVRYDWGNEVNNGGKGRWYDTSRKSPSSDRDIKFVRPAVKFNRKKQNHPIHIGQITWDHAYVQGYDEDEQLFVEVEVTDSVQNKARHRGIIDENNFWITSQPYGYGHSDGLRAEADYASGGGILPPDDKIQGQGHFVDIQLDEVVKYKAYTYSGDAIGGNTAYFVSAELEVKVKYSTYSYTGDAIGNAEGSFVGASIAITGINRTLPAENIQGVPSFVTAEIKK